MAYEKKYHHKIGTPGFPLPVLVSEEKTVGGKTVVSKKLGVVESGDNPYVLQSSIPDTATVQGRLYRSLPSRNMLPLLEELLNRSQPGQTNHTAFVRGDPAVGKSYAMIKFCELRDARGPLVADSGGQSLQNLLYRVVFSTEDRKSVQEMVDTALRNDALSDISLKALQVYGKHFKADDRSIDWKGLQHDKEIGFEKTDAVLASIFRIEGWENKASNIGFRIEHGALIEADIENRDLLVDEVNKSVEGSEMPLQIVAQVLNGETTRHRVSLGGKGDYELVNGAASGKHNLVLFTGNFPKDGAGTREMSDSWNRRLPPFDISEFTKEDWQDRAGSLLTNLPLCILHEISEGSWKKIDGADQWVLKDPEAFKETLLMLSTLGMSDAEKLRVKEWQIALISNWQNTLPAVHKLGAFYHKWSELVNPDSPSMKQGDFPDIMMEVEDPRQPTMKVTPSDMIRAINDALIMRPEKKSADRSGGFDLKRNWNTPVSTHKIQSEPVSAHFGTRLTEAIMQQIDRGTAGKPHLRAQLMADAKEAGLIGVGGKSAEISRLLNVDVSKDKVVEAKSLQSLLCSALRRRYPDDNLSAYDDEILPIRHVQAELEAMRTSTRDATLSPFATRLQMPQTDIDEVGSSLFREVVACAAETDESLKKAQKRMPPKSLMMRDDLFTALALPVVGKTNLTSLWNTSLTNGAFAPDPATAMAENVANNGVATTTILCRADDEARYETLHILRNSKIDRGRTVIIGDTAVSDEMYDRLKRNNIVYINRSYPEAAAWINSEVRNMVEPRYEPDVKKAFLLRNEAKENASLAELLAQPELSTTTQPNFVTTMDPKDVSHATRETGKKAGGAGVVSRLA